MRWIASSFGLLAAIALAIGWIDRANEREPPFANRIWVDHLPKDARDRVRMLIPVRDGDEAFGAAHASSRFSIRAEIFTFERNGADLALRFLQARQTLRLKMRTWRCEGEAPKPFQLCLELSDGRDRVVLYSRDDWRIGSRELPIDVPTPEAPREGCHECAELRSGPWFPGEEPASR